jgi:hypothetical protein
MLHYEVTAIVVTDTKLFNRTGDIGRWAERINVAFTAHAIEKAPSSLLSGRPNKSRANAAHPSGSMKLSISGEVNRVGIRQLETIVLVDVPYAMYVLKGTPALIFSKSARIPAGEEGAGQFVPLVPGTGMYLPGQPAWAARRRQRVRGQRANNFLADAFDATARTHSSLRGFQMVG